MKKLLIVYYSRTGNTRKMAHEIAKGASNVAGIEVIVKKVTDTNNNDLLYADAVIMGSPTYFRQMSAELKLFIDKSVKVYEKLKNKIGAVFTSTGTRKDGEKCLVSPYEALDCHGLKVVAKVLAVGAPNAKVKKECKKLGKQVARKIVED